jgi:GMP synthase-like glutamine amidotransferase
MRILVAQHDPDKGLGLLAAGLEDGGAILDVRHAGREPLDLDGHAAVIALPGVADPPDDTPAVRETRALLVDALAAGLPVLGVCLGAELLAEAAGGSTARCRPEFGFGPVRLLPAAADDPLLAGLPAELTAFHAHAYAVAEPLPAGAEALACSDSCLQAFRLGERAWGVQFHPEAAPGPMEGWLATVPAFQAHGVDAAATLRLARRDAPAWERWASDIGRRFAVAAQAPMRHSSPGRTHATWPPTTTRATGLRPKR